MSIETKQGLHGNVILTIINARGTVIVHETVKPDDVEAIIERNTR